MLVYKCWLCWQQPAGAFDVTSEELAIAAEVYCQQISMVLIVVVPCVRSACLLSRDVCFATPGGFRDPVRPPWEDRRQPLVPALAGTGDPHGQPADIPSELQPARSNTTNTQRTTWASQPGVFERDAHAGSVARPVSLAQQGCFWQPMR